MRVLFRNRTLLLTDLIGWSVLPLAALFVRLDGIDGFGPYLQRVLLFTGWALLFQFLAMYAGGMYRGAWRYASIEEFSGIAGCLAVAAVAAAAAHFWVGQFIPLFMGAQRLPRSLPIINGIFAIAWSSGTRFVLRYAAYLRQRATGRLGRPRAILVGATPEMGRLIASIQADPQAAFDPVLVVANEGDGKERGERGYLSGVRILGELRDLLPLLRSHHASVVLLSPALLSHEQLRRVWDLARQIGASIQVLPLGEDADRLGWRAVRDLAIEDLYVPARVEGADREMREAYRGLRVLITGAAGVPGLQLSRRLARSGVRQLMLVDHSEEGLWGLVGALRAEHPEVEVVPLVADLRDVRRMETLFVRHTPDIVLHAASPGNVELMESNPEEAVLTTIGATFAVARAAEISGAKGFVHASSDLAVDPTSILGASKLVAERYVSGIGERTGRRFLSVRFGALLGGPAGLPRTLRDAIMHGGPVDLPHPDVRRCVTGVDACAELLLDAAILGHPGSVVLQSGPAVRIAELATDLARLAKKEPGRDIEFRYADRAPGPRQFDALLAPFERPEVLSSDLLVAVTEHPLPRPTERWILSLLQSAREGDLAALRGALAEFAPLLVTPAPAAARTAAPARSPAPTRTSGGSRAKAT